MAPSTSRRGLTIDTHGKRKRGDGDEHPRTPIAKRSRGGGEPQLTRVCCMRCALHLHKDGRACDKTAIRKCWRCAAARKPCVPIPTAFIERLNAWMEEWDNLPSDGDEEAMRTRLASLMADAQQSKRVADRADGVSPAGHARGFGGGSAGSTAAPLLRELRGIRQMLTHAVDSYRSVNGLPALDLTVEDDDDEDDDDDE